MNDLQRLVDLQQRGITLTVDDGDLVVNDPDTARTDDDEAWLRQHKPDLVSLLNRPSEPSDSLKQSDYSDGHKPGSFAARLAAATTTLAGLGERYNGDVEWVAEGYFALGELAIIPGPPESYKSWLMADLARAVHVEGARWVGSLPVRHGKVIYFEQERARNLVYQTRRLAAGWGQNLDDMLTVEPCGIDICDLDHQANIITMLEQQRPLLVIINSYKAVFRGRPADSADVASALQWLGHQAEKLSMTVAIVDGDNKAGATGQLRGMAAHADSVQKEYEADAILHVERKRDEVGRGVGPASVYVGKRRHGDPGVPFMFDVQKLDDDSAKAIWLDETTIERDVPIRRTGRDRVLSAVPGDGSTMSRKAIAEATDLAVSTVSALLSGLAGEGLVEQTDRHGNWRRRPSEPSDRLRESDYSDGPADLGQRLCPKHGLPIIEGDRCIECLPF